MSPTCTRGSRESRWEIFLSVGPDQESVRAALVGHTTAALSLKLRCLWPLELAKSSRQGVLATEGSYLCYVQCS